MGRIPKKNAPEEPGSPPRLIVPSVVEPGVPFEVILELDDQKHGAMDVLLAGLNIRAVDQSEPSPVSAPELWCGECSCPLIVVRASDATNFTARRHPSAPASPVSSSDAADPADKKLKNKKKHESPAVQRFVFDRCRVACSCPREHLGVRHVVLVLAPVEATRGRALVSAPLRISCSCSRGASTPSGARVSPSAVAAAAGPAAAPRDGTSFENPNVAPSPPSSQGTLPMHAHNGGGPCVGVCLVRVAIARDVLAVLVAYLRDSLLNRIDGFVSLALQDLGEPHPQQQQQQAQRSPVDEAPQASSGVTTSFSKPPELPDQRIVCMFATCRSEAALNCVRETAQKYWHNEFGFENCLCSDLVCSGLLVHVRCFCSSVQETAAAVMPSVTSSS